MGGGRGSAGGLGSVDRGSEDRKVHGRRPEGAGGGDDKIPGFFPGGDLRSGGGVGGGVGRVPGGGVAGVSAEGAGIFVNVKVKMKEDGFRNSDLGLGIWKAEGEKASAGSIPAGGTDSYIYGMSLFINEKQ